MEQMEESLLPQANRPSLPESVSDQYISIQKKTQMKENCPFKPSPLSFKQGMSTATTTVPSQNLYSK